MFSFERENLTKGFETIKNVLENYNFPKFTEINNSNVRKWVYDAINNSVAWFDDEDDAAVLDSNPEVRVYYGATKLVLMVAGIDKWVFKLPFKELRTNFCQLEVEIYEDAEREGFDAFFAPCYFLKNFNGARVYVMQKAEISCGLVRSDLYRKLSDEGRDDEEISEIVDEASDMAEFVEWLFPFYMGYDEFQKFTNFLNNENINDLHDGNIGYINGHIVLIDYSGYR